MTTRLLPAAALVALIAPWTVRSQTGSVQTFRFQHAGAKQQAEETGMAISSMTYMPVRTDFARGMLSVQGTPDQLKAGAWLFAELDKSAPVAADLGLHEYRLADGFVGTGNVVRVFFLDRGQTAQELKDFVQMVRNIADLPQAFTVNAIKTVALRGTSDQMALADFFVNELGKTRPALRQHSESPQYLALAGPSPSNAAGANENAVRIFYFANTPVLLDFQIMSALFQVLADVRLVYPYNTPRALAVRGTADQLALVDWLFNELDQPAHPNPSHQSDVYNYRVVDRENATAVRVFYLPSIATVQEVDRIASQVSGQAQIRRVFTFNPARAVAVRGSPDQLATAARLLAASDPADFPAAR
jgi:hypothetical protein